MSDWAQLVAERALATREELRRSVSVGISGVDCAGKSTLARSVCELLDGRGVASVLVAGDEFTRPTSERYVEADDGLGYYRDSFDYRELFERILPAVRRNEHAELAIAVSDWERDAWREEQLVLVPSSVVVVEGCFLFAGGHARAFDLSVWIDLPLDEVVPRALQRPRDVERMGGASGVRDRYGRRYLPGQRIHIERDAPAAQATVVLR